MIDAREERQNTEQLGPIMPQEDGDRLRDQEPAVLEGIRVLLGWMAGRRVGRVVATDPASEPPSPAGHSDPGAALWTILAGVARAIAMVVAGIILLLPGACAAFFMRFGFSDNLFINFSLVLLWIACFVIAAAGIWMIIGAIVGAASPGRFGTFARTFVMTAVGVILLLLGACAAYFMSQVGLPPPLDFLLIGFWGVCLLIAAGGVWLLIRAFR